MIPGNYQLKPLLNNFYLLPVFQHSQELEIIYRHSPFKTETDIFSQFDKIESDTGTLVILMHMKLLDNGEAELDIASDPTDIIMGSEKGLSHEGLVNLESLKLPLDMSNW